MLVRVSCSHSVVRLLSMCRGLYAELEGSGGKRSVFRSVDVLGCVGVPGFCILAERVRHVASHEVRCRLKCRAVGVLHVQPIRFAASSFPAPVSNGLRREWEVLGPL